MWTAACSKRLSKGASSKTGFWIGGSGDLPPKFLQPLTRDTPRAAADYVQYEDAEMKVIRKEDVPRPSPELRDTFTHRVGLGMLLKIDEKVQVRVAYVSFEPGARTYWHTHPGGQILHVVKGTGLIQTWEDRAENKKAEVIRPEDVVYIPPDEKHWHGADPENPMEHIAHSMGGDTVWMEEVAEEDYAKASPGKL